MSIDKDTKFIIKQLLDSQELNIYWNNENPLDILGFEREYFGNFLCWVVPRKSHQS